MTKHNKKHILAGGTKCIIRCCGCDYSTIGSKKDVDLRFKLHMKNKHGVDNYGTIDISRTSNSKNYHNNAIKDEPARMAELLKLLRK